MNEDLKQIGSLLHEVKGMTTPNTATGNATITVSAGGVGLWVAVTACLVSMAVSLVGLLLVGLALSDLNRQTQELRQSDALINAYINSGLAPKQEEQK